MNAMQRATAGPYIGLDLGGSKLGLARVTGGRMTDYSVHAVAADASADDVVAFLLDRIRAIMDGAVGGIGVGVPGVVDVAAGVVYETANIPSWKEVHLKDILQRELNVPVHVNNDVNCFVLGEKHFGKATRCRNVVGMCLGTGMGAGILINGTLYSGRNGGAGELGAIPYRQSVLENYCSGRFFPIYHAMSGLDAYRRACDGDARALAAFAEFGEHVGNAIATALLAYDPEMVVLGGSVSNAYPFFIDATMHTLASFPYRNTIRRLRIERSETEHTAVLGAAALCYAVAA
jgi:glucokinase